MFSFVFNLICKNLPFIGSFKEERSKTDSTESQSWVMVSSPNQSACLSDQSQAGEETPQSYGRSLYEQFVNEVTDKAQKVGFPQEQLLVNRQSIMQGMKLIGTFLKENCFGNQGINRGINKLIMSIRNLQEEKAKIALKERPLSLEDRTSILSETQDEIEYDYCAIEQEDELTTPNQDVTNKFTILSQNSIPLWLKKLVNKNKTEQINAEYEDHEPRYEVLSLKLKQTSRTIIGAVNQGIVLLAQSPFPGLICVPLSSFFKTLMFLNKEFQIVEKVQVTSVECIKKVMPPVTAAAKKHRSLAIALEAMSTVASTTSKVFVACKTRLAIRAARRRLHQRRAISRSWR